MRVLRNELYTLQFKYYNGFLFVKSQKNNVIRCPWNAHENFENDLKDKLPLIRMIITNNMFLNYHKGEAIIDLSFEEVQILNDIKLN